jgi:hypothetical protein
MAIRRVGRAISRRSNRPRRRYEWARFVQGSVGVAVGAKLTVDLLANFQTSLGAQLIGATVTRTIVHFSAIGNTGGANFSNTVWGLIKEDLAYAGNPTANPNADWMYVQGCEMFPDQSSATVVPNLLQDRDVRSKRKLDALDETLLFVYQNGSLQVINVAFRVDTLLALP